VKGFIRTIVAAALAIGVLSFGAAPALATHVQCGDVITQDTKLDNDVVDCPPNIDHRLSYPH
jgi:hypothetical protein